MTDIVLNDINRSPSTKNLFKALLAAKKKLEPIIRGNENPFYKRGGSAATYADLDTVIEATEPALLDEGIILTQFPISSALGIGVFTMLVHVETDEYFGMGCTLPLAKNDAQSGVGAITYLRRAAIKGVLNVAERDDDGNTASGLTERKKEEVKRPPKAEPAPRPVEIKSVVTVSNDALPTPEQLDGYRTRFGKLIDGLASAGLKSSKGLPFNVKVKMFLLKETGQKDIEQVTVGQWENFFNAATNTASAENGMEELVQQVNRAVEEA